MYPSNSGLSGFFEYQLSYHIRGDDGQGDEGAVQKMDGIEGGTAEHLAAEIYDQKLHRANKGHYKYKGLISCDAGEDIYRLRSRIEGIEYSAEYEHCKKCRQMIKLASAEKDSYKGAF